MSINLNLHSKIFESEGNLKVQFIPAATDGDGPANLESHFDPYTTVDDNNFLTNSIRGYPLKGERVDLPKGLVGVCSRETNKPLDETASRVMKAFGSFENFIYWNYDKLPSKGDPLKQAMQIIDISDELCKPVTIAEIKKEMADYELKMKKTKTELKD